MAVNENPDAPHSKLTAPEGKLHTLGSKFSPETWIAVGILLITLAAYLQVGWFHFVTFDDPLYITSNPTIQQGLNWKTLRYAFTSGDDGSYLPLVWLSHAACVSLFNTWAGGHHLVNLFFHIFNSVLLFYFFKRLTHGLWPSACVAFLFAIHPLHVESVAWIAERKDVLSTFFWILTSWAYIRYVDQPTRLRYFAMAVLFTLGLLSKSMLVTLPLTLLLFDIWPLKRIDFSAGWRGFHPRNTWPLLVEKAPLLALSLGAAAATFLIQRQIGAVVSLSGLPLHYRFGNAIITIIIYLKQTILPINLSAFYPFSWTSFPFWNVALAFAFILIITFLCAYNCRRRPYLIIGWLWYLVTLAPVVGLIQVGSQAHADRYTYVPLIGIFIMIGWSCEELISSFRISRRTVLLTAASLLGVLLTLTAAQVVVWRDNVTLFKNAFSLDTENPVALLNIGDEYAKRGQFENAYAAYFRGLQFSPGLYLSHLKVGYSLESLGRNEEALHYYKIGKRLKMDHLSTDQRIGMLLVRMGRFDQAEPYVQRVLARTDQEANFSDPLTPSVTQIDWAVILMSRNRAGEAVQILENVLRKDPQSQRGHGTLGLALRETGRLNEALDKLQTASKLNPKDPEPLYHQGILLTQMARYTDAKKIFDQLKELNPSFPLLSKGIRNLEEAQASISSCVQPSRVPSIGYNPKSSQKKGEAP